MSSGFGFPATLDSGAVRLSDNLGVPAADTAIFQRVRDGGSISKIGVGIATQGGSISLGVYRNVGKGRNAKPGPRIAYSGNVACPAPGYVELALDKALRVRAGDWLALSCSSTSATFRSLLAAGGDYDFGKGRQYRQGTAHPLPTTAGTLVATTGYTIVLIGA